MYREESAEEIEMFYPLSGQLFHHSNSPSASPSPHAQSVSSESTNDTVFAPTYMSMKELAASYKSQGRFDEAHTLLKECVDGSISNLGDYHPLTLRAMSDLGDLYHAQGRHTEFEKIYKYCVEISEQEQGLQNEDTIKYQDTLASHYESLALTSLNNLSRIYESQGRTVDLERILNAVAQL